MNTNRALSDNERLESLRWWSALVPDSVRRKPVYDLTPLRTITDLASAFGRSRWNELDAALKESNHFLSPLDDPLQCDLGLHDWLRPEREESYSMWLAWCLQHLSRSELLQLLQLSELDCDEVFTVDREVAVEYEDAASTGRLDVVVYDGSRAVLIIEVKTKPYTEEDLEKQAEYARSRVAREATLIFIAADVPDLELYGFRPIPWADICIGLRLSAPSIRGRHGVLPVAMVLAFVGAVEQNLLKFTTEPGNYTAVPAILQHLRRYLDSANNCKD